MANIFSLIKVSVIETPGLQFKNCHLITFSPFLFVCLLVLTVDPLHLSQTSCSYNPRCPYPSNDYVCNDLEPGWDGLCCDVTNYGVREGLLAGGTVWEVGTSGLPACGCSSLL